jgi:hypothetical protein
MENPFLNNSVLTYYDESIDKTVDLNQNNISKYFNCVYVLVKKTYKQINESFYNYLIPKEIYDEYVNEFIIHKVSIEILKINKHFNNLIIMSNEQLKTYNIFSYELNDKNIVIPILNISYRNILSYIEQFNTNNTLENLYKVITVNKYFENTNSEKVNKLIIDLDYSDYWCKKENCLINISTEYLKRNFIFSASRIKDSEVLRIIQTVFEAQINNTGKEDYINKRKNKKYTDITTVVNKKGYSQYYIEKSDFSKDEITNLFNSLSIYQQTILFANLLVNKKYSNLVINNLTILKQMQPQILQDISYFRYFMCYTWFKLYFDECIKKENTKTTDDFIFDIETASYLPEFTFNHQKPKENPYMPILVADEILDAKNNFCSLPEKQTKCINGIANLKKFKQNLNLFCSSNAKIDLFENFDFNKYGVAITGSVMSACIQKYHPLLDNFNGETYNELFIHFVQEYYNDADIDIMFKAKDNFIFYDNVKEFYNQIIVNILLYNEKAKPEHTHLILNKLGYIFVTTDFILKNISTDIKYINDNINSPDVKQLFKPFYDKLCSQKYNELIKDITIEELIKLEEKYPDIYKKENNFDVDFNIYISDQVQKDIDLEFTYKYKIATPYINHTLEIFSIKHDDFFGCISTFHLPCVRAYYNGNVYMTPSCITAHLTYMNIDYKYITGCKDPFDIINKYRQRGFGTWLNDNEKILMLKYINHSPYWKKYYNSVNDNIFGMIKMTHSLFQQKKLNNIYVNENHYKINKKLQIYSYTKTNVDSLYYKYNCDTTTLINSIDSKGFIIKFCKAKLYSYIENIKS